MELDFNKPSPQAKNLKEAQQIIDALWLHIAKLHELIERQAAEIADLKEKLNTNSSNSSKPPSTDFSKKPKKKIKQHGAGKNQGTKQGAQPGHQGKGRELLPAEAVDYTVVCLPKTTCDCGGKVQATADSFRRHQQFELPEIKPIVTEYHRVYGECSRCGLQHCGELPPGIPNTVLGPRAIASVGIFSCDYRLSRRMTRILLSDFFGLDVCLGTVSNAEKTVSAALKQPVEELHGHVKQQPVVNADETSHKQQGNKMWMWLVTTALVSVFIIRSTRCTKSAQTLLGATFAGILCTDRYSAYNWVKTTCRQLCWAHLIRDIQKISERSGLAGKVGDDILGHICRMFRLWRLFKSGQISRRTLKRAMKPIRNNIELLLALGAACGHKKTENTCRNILKYKAALWVFVEMEGVEPTNNLSEQQLRAYVLWRKNSFGTQSERGNEFVERMMSTTATCKLQGRNRYDYITQAVAAYLKNEPVPSLLPPNESYSPSLKLAA